MQAFPGYPLGFFYILFSPSLLPIWFFFVSQFLSIWAIFRYFFADHINDESNFLPSQQMRLFYRPFLEIGVPFESTLYLENASLFKYFFSMFTGVWLYSIYHKPFCMSFSHFLYPATKTVVGYYAIPSEPFECLPVLPSVDPFVSASFLDSKLNSFWPIFFKLCMDIDIREEWFGIANGLNLLINNIVMAPDWCKNVLFLNILRTNGWILIKFCMCILYLMHIIFGQFLTELWPLMDVRLLFMLNILCINLWISIKFCICTNIDKMQIWMIEQYFSFIFNRVMALDWCQNFVYAQYPLDQLWDFDKIL